MIAKKKATYGLIGYPVKHSLSPAMHNAAFQACGINAEYKLFEVPPKDLEDFLFKRKDIAGFTITIPHKVEALRLLKQTTAQADAQVFLIGAVNTLKRVEDKILYTNTDYQGFRRSLVDDLRFAPKNKKVLMLGCGGAGRAVSVALSQEPKIKQVYIYEPNPQIAKSSFELGYQVNFIAQEDIAKVILDCQLLINASPVGMKPADQPVIDKDLLHKGLFVYDLVYNRETELIREAKTRCQAACGGVGMLLYQGALAWEFWAEQRAPVEVMRAALEEELRK